MRSILEKALIALLNEDKAKADALFHDFILERSRQIHESLRQGEDFVLDESWEQELAIDEMFTEADLEDEVIVSADEAGEEQAEAGEEQAEAGEEQAEAGEETIEDRVDDIEAELQRLSAEFSELVGDADEGEAKEVTEATIEVTDGDTVVHIDTDESGEASVGAPVGAAQFESAVASPPSGGNMRVIFTADYDGTDPVVNFFVFDITKEDPIVNQLSDECVAEVDGFFSEFNGTQGDWENIVAGYHTLEAGTVTRVIQSIGVDSPKSDIYAAVREIAEKDGVEEAYWALGSDDDFANLGESILDELKRLDVKGDVEGMTSGEKVAVDTTSRVTSKPSDKRVAGEPVRIKSEKRSGFEREAAPKSDTFKARRNTLKSATDNLKTSSKEGNASAELNKLGDDKTAQAGLFNKKI